MSITNSGKKYELHIREILSSKKVTAKLGDGVFTIGNVEIYHETKGVENLNNKNLNTNQIRPIKYLPIIFQLTKPWKKRNNIQNGAQHLVLPACLCLKLASGKRGQHTPDSVPVVRLSLSRKSYESYGLDIDKWVATDSNLKKIVKRAYLLSESDKKTKSFIEERKSLYEEIVEKNKKFAEMIA